LDRSCRRVLNGACKIILGGKKSNHERHGAPYGLIKDLDKELASMFDGLSRSNAMLQLIVMRSRKLVTDAQMASFSPDIQESARSFLKL
jgi:hypothetical protein